MKNYPFILIVFLFGCSSSMRFEKHSDSNLINQLVKFDSAKLFFKVDDLPKPLTAFFKQEHIVLADTGKFYLNTDVHFDDATPTSRIIFGGEASKDLAFIIYESQGITTQSHLIVFEILSKKIVNVEQKIIDCRPLAFVELKECIH